MDLLKGSVQSLADHLGAKQTVKVRTPNAVAAVRSTTWFMQIEEDSSTCHCTCNGTVELWDPNEKERMMELSAHHHKAVNIRLEEGEPIVKDEKMRYHTDVQINALAAQIGETCDWTDKE